MYFSIRMESSRKTVEAREAAEGWVQGAQGSGSARCQVLFRPGWCRHQLPLLQELAARQVCERGRGREACPWWPAPSNLHKGKLARGPGLGSTALHKAKGPKEQPQSGS